MEKYQYFKKFNWSSNPFTLNISPELMVGYSNQIDSLLSHIFNSHKIALIVGHTGSGKTTLMTWLNNFINDNKHNFQSFYIPKPPRTKKPLVLIFKSLFGYNITDYLQFRQLNMVNLSKYITKKTKTKKTIFLIDEAHECSIEVLEWLRTLADMTPNTIFIFAGLATFENMIDTQIPTFSMRITTKIYLKNLNDVETESLIRKRIENIGGNGLGPFTPDASLKIFKTTGGFPREIIKTCDRLIKDASQKNISTINKTFVENLFHIPGVDESFEETTISLSKKQKKILDVLNKQPKISPTKIVEFSEFPEYKNKNNAIRSVNNILKRLMRDELIERKKSGNTYVYFLSGKAKSMLAKA